MKVTISSLKPGRVVQASASVSGSGTVEHIARQGRYVLVTFTGSTHAYRYLRHQLVTV